MRPQRRTTVKRSPSGLGVDFGASLLEVRQRFGPPVGVIRHADLLVYGYWHQENGQIVLDKGYKLFEFHNGRLTSITAFFTDFVLPRSVRRGTQRSTVIAKYGPPDRTVRGREPIAEPGFGPVPFPTAVPLAAWIIAGLAAAVLSRLICVTAPIRESRWLRAFALACVGSISFLLGITAIMGAGGRLTMPIMLSIARMAMPIGFVYGLLYGLVFWPRMVADGQSRALWRTAAFLVVGTVCGLILLRLIARGHWTTLTFISLSFGSFGLAWVFWSWLVTVLTASSTREAG